MQPGEAAWLLAGGGRDVGGVSGLGRRSGIGMARGVATGLCLAQVHFVPPNTACLLP